MCRSEIITKKLMLERSEYLRLKYSIFLTDLIIDDVSLLSFASSKLWKSTELIRSCDFYKLDDLDSDAIFFIAALTISLILYCICCHIFDNNTIMITTRDCDDLSILCLKTFLIVSKSNRRSEKYSDISSVKDKSFFKNRENFEDLISFIKFMICSKQRIVSQTTN